MINISIHGVKKFRIDTPDDAEGPRIIHLELDDGTQQQITLWPTRQIKHPTPNDKEAA